MVNTLFVCLLFGWFGLVASIWVGWVCWLIFVCFVFAMEIAESWIAVDID